MHLVEEQNTLVYIHRTAQDLWFSNILTALSSSLKNVVCICTHQIQKKDMRLKNMSYNDNGSRGVVDQ